MRTILMCAALAALPMAGCGEDAGGGTGTRVVASAYPLAYLAEQVGGPGVEVDDLTPPGAEPHDLELPPRDVAELADADLVLYLGGGFQPGVEDAVEQSGATAVDLLPDGADDPHVWLDPTRYADLAFRVADALGDRQAAAVFAHRLDDLDAQYEAGLADCERREIVVAHAAFAYLAERYDLEEIPLAGISPEAEATPQDLERVARLVRERGLTTVFVEPLAPRDEAEVIARETGARTAVLDPVEGLTAGERERGDDYLTIMRRNLETLREALGCR